MTLDWLMSPGLILIGGAVFAGYLKTSSRVVLLLLPLLCLAVVWLGKDYVSATLMSYQLVVVQKSDLGLLFATTFSVIAFGGLWFAFKQAARTELSGALLYAGSAISLVLCGDFITFFIFWELMAIGSTMILFSSPMAASFNATMRYALIHLLSGMILLAGIIGLIWQSGDASLRALELSSVYEWMILAGFLINAGAPPLSAWVADAYPEGSVSGSVFLSAFTTKSAVFALLVVFAGNAILIPIGIYMMFYGIIYALSENDMRRILAYSIVNQVGFMITGVGIGSEMAINGVAAHASAHIIYKGLLLMSVGGVLYATNQRKCSELGGLNRVMRLTMICSVIGAISISAVPLTSGFVAKSLISEAAQQAEMIWVWGALLAASAGVFLHAGIPWFVFFQNKPQRRQVLEVPSNMKAAMVFLSILCIAMGVFPQQFYQLLPYPVDYQPYTLAHLLSQSQFLVFAMIAFFLMLPLLKRTPTITLDTDWLYRRLPICLQHYLKPTYLRIEKIGCRIYAHGLAIAKSRQPHINTIGRDISTTTLIIVLGITLSILLAIYYL
ncbi:MAG: Na(+)/H(+) antiporter subunit D [Chromatiales bacterium]|nr:Na(+)/H(+) antiporter subunit D [Chromatiales bacterium]